MELDCLLRCSVCAKSFVLALDEDAPARRVLAGRSCRHCDRLGTLRLAGFVDDDTDACNTRTPTRATTATKKANAMTSRSIVDGIIDQLDAQTARRLLLALDAAPRDAMDLLRFVARHGSRQEQQDETTLRSTG